MTIRRTKTHRHGVVVTFWGVFNAMSRPQTLPGNTVMIKTGCGKLYVTDNTDSEYPEIILRLGKDGCCPRVFLQALAKTASKALRYGMPKEKLIQQWKKIQCPSPTWYNGKQVFSCPDAVAQVLEANMGQEEVEPLLR